MEILFEVIVWILQVIFELIVQLIGQVIAESIGHGLSHTFERSKPVDPVYAAIGYVALGAGIGALSLLFLPELYIRTPWLRYANLLITPLLAGLVMGWIGAWRRRHEMGVIRIESFSYGFVFAFSMAVVRVMWGK